MANEMAGGMQDIGQAVSALGIGEKLAVLGAAGVLVGWLLFDLVMTEYGVGQLPFIVAAFTVFLAYRYHMQKATDWPVGYATLVIVLAGILGVLGVRELALDLRYEILDVGGLTAVGALVFWIAAIAAGAGAVQMAMAGRE